MGGALKEKLSKEIDNGYLEEKIDHDLLSVGEIQQVVEAINSSNLKPKQKETVNEIITMSEQYSGPIPHPEHLRQYEDILPGSADRILQMVENQSKHRMDNEDKIVNAEIINRNRGQLFGFVLAMIGLIGGFLLILANKDGAGIATLVIAIGTLVASFMFGAKKGE